MKFILDLGIILLAAHIGGTISRKFKQPAVLGQIIVGIILGMGIMTKTESIENFAELGVIFLMFIAGLETDVNELRESSKSSSLIALGGILAPSIFVFTGMYVYTSDFKTSIFMGIVATATSVSISVQTLREIGQLRTRQGISILGAAIIDDVIGIILLTLAVGFFAPTEGSSILQVILGVVAFFLLVFFVGNVIVKLSNRFDKDIRVGDNGVYYAIIICFLLAFVSEEMGVAAITGSYFAGVVVSMTSHRHTVSHEVSKFAGVLFTPVFFVSIGMGVDLGSAFSAVAVGGILIVLGFIGKVAGSGIGAKLSGFSSAQALQIGIGMVPRAEVAIIMANLGLKLGVLSDRMLAGTILMVVVTTLLTPSLLKWSFDRE